MKFSLNIILKFLSVLIVLLLLSACASSTKKVNVLDVDERATQRWEKLLSGDIAGAYEYLSPGHRSSVSSVSYQRSILLKKVRWTGAKLIKSDCEETTCAVTFLLDFSVRGALPGVKNYNGSQQVEETWLLVDGMWYLVPKS